MNKVLNLSYKQMTLRQILSRIAQQEDINFLLTNRIPRQALTRFVGWFSKIQHPWISRPSISLWKLFSDLDLSEAKESHFNSAHACFTRQLKEGVRLVDMNQDVLSSPCDAIVGAAGKLNGIELIQAKGFPYTLTDLLHDPELVEYYRDGSYVTLRLTSSMYHRFHSPYDCMVKRVTYISGDTWNVNPIALKRVERLFCKNERAVIETNLPATASDKSHIITLVPVAAVLVASIRLHWLDDLFHLKYRGPNVIHCNASFKKGEEMGWFQHGSTIIVFAPTGFELCNGITQGVRINMGDALLCIPRE